MSRRLAVSAIVTLVLVLPGLGSASSTQTKTAPYQDVRNDAHFCDTDSTTGSCSSSGSANQLTGAIGVNLAVGSADGLPGRGSAFAQPHILGEFQMGEATQIVVTATFHVNSASASRDGTFANATGRTLATAYAIAFLQVRQLTGDCDETHGCIEPGSCVLCDGSDINTTIVDVSTGATHIENQDVTVVVTLTHPTGRFSAGTLHFDAGIQSQASLESVAVPDDGSAAVSVDASLTSVVAEFF